MYGRSPLSVADVVCESGTPPRNLTVTTITSTSATFSWSPPVKPNGEITKYQIQCLPDEDHIVSDSQTTSATLSGLLPYTNYSCSITAHTSVGGGPAATTSVATEQDSKILQQNNKNYFHKYYVNAFSSKWTSSKY